MIAEREHIGFTAQPQGDVKENPMKHFALAAVLGAALLLAHSFSAPAHAQRGGYWYPGGGPTSGGMYKKTYKKKVKSTHKKSHE
jgi:hypothetical protein